MQPGSEIRFGTSPGRWVIALAVLGSGIAFLEATVVNVALPSIAADLDADVAGLQWTINGYLLTLAALILIGGSLGDRYGRRKVFVVGVIWFTLASALCALAPNVEVLVVARVLQGVGGALLTPGSLAIIEATFHPSDRARAIGAWSALGGIAGAIGPLLGGWLVDAVDWRAIFLINLPLGAFVAWAAPRHIPETRDETVTGRLDLRGSLLAVLALGGLTFALIQAAEAGEMSGGVALALAIGALATIAFFWVERTSEHPMMPLSIFSSMQFSAANAVTFVVYAALGGVFFLLVIVLQVVLGYSALAAGAAALPVTALMLLLSARAGALAQRIGPKLPLTAGPLLIAAGMVMMSGIGVGDTYVGSILPAVIVYGLGLALVVAPITATVLAAADARHAGLASGVNNAVARTAQLAAVAALPLLVGLSGGDFQDPAALSDGFTTAMLITAALSAAGGVLAFFFISNDVLERAEPEPGRCPGYLDDEYQCGVDGPPLRHAPPVPVSLEEPEPEPAPS
ncbi:MAG TPA: MFS transporter [Solirubrobacterales bacterium]|nr:MFS transporter [Solirubrobacterales bacterium]